MKRSHQEAAAAAAGDGGRGRVSGTATAASRLMLPIHGEDQEGKAIKAVPDAGDDELLAALGYKVRSSSMADIARKLEQLEMAMAGGGVGIGVGIDHGGGDGGDGGVLTQLASETVHYNPSDLNSWVENMLSELNVPPPPQPIEGGCAAAAERVTTNLDFSGSVDANSGDLTAIVPIAARENKRVKSSTSRTTSAVTAPPPAQQQTPVVVVMEEEESQEAGIRLVHALLACAEAVQKEKFALAETLVNQITLLSTSQGGAMRKVAIYFADALIRRIRKIYPTPSPAPPPAEPPSSALLTDLLEMHFYEACPYLKFAHFTANQAILEAFSGKTRVHVIDFGMKQGMQWPPLMQALAVRPGGPPFFHLTGIGPPQPNNSDHLQEVGWKLAKFAESINVGFEYRGFVANSLADIEPYMLEVSGINTVAVNSILELHRVLAKPGAIAKVLATVKSLKPTIVTMAEQEANHNGTVFLDRFTEALHYYCSMFDSLEGGGNNTPLPQSTKGDDLAMAEVYLGRQICDVVAKEGPERLERHETAEQWKKTIGDAGFEMVPLGSNAFKQASMLLEVFSGGNGYRVEEKDGYLMLGWHTSPLITTSAWSVTPAAAAAGGRGTGEPSSESRPSKTTYLGR